MWIKELAPMCLKKIGLRAQSKVTIVGSIVNMIEGLVWPLHEHNNLHFDNE